MAAIGTVNILRVSGGDCGALTGVTPPPRAGSVSSLPSTLFRRSLPGSASELRYPQGGSLPSGGAVVRRTHRGRWGPRDDNNKVRVGVRVGVEVVVMMMMMMVVMMTM